MKKSWLLFRNERKQGFLNAIRCEDGIAVGLSRLPEEMEDFISEKRPEVLDRLDYFQLVEGSHWYGKDLGKLKHLDMIDGWRLIAWTTYI